MTKNGKILLVLSKWPSDLAPYITKLSVSLLESEKYDVDVFANRIGDMRKAEALFDSEKAATILSKIKLKFDYKKNLIEYFKLFYSLVFFPLRLLKAIFRLKDSMGLFQGIKHALNFHQLLRKEYDVVYFIAIQLMPHFNFKDLFPGAKILASTRGQDFELFPSKFENFLKTLDAVHVLSEYGKNQVLKHNKEGEIKVFKILPAYDPSHNTSMEIKLDKEYFHIGTASRLFWTKGIEYSLRALASLSTKLGDQCKIQYHLIGDGPEREFLEWESRRLGLGAMVKFYGWLPQPIALGIQSQLDLYILLSIEEGFNNSVVQAQALGVPCLVSNSGGLPENIEDKMTGYVVDKYDHEKPTEIIEKLIQESELRKLLGKNGIQRAGREFTYEKHVNGYFEMFSQVLNN